MISGWLHAAPGASPLPPHAAALQGGARQPRGGRARGAHQQQPGRGGAGLPGGRGFAGRRFALPQPYTWGRFSYHNRKPGWGLRFAPWRRVSRSAAAPAAAPAAARPPASPVLLLACPLPPGPHCAGAAAGVPRVQREHGLRRHAGGGGLHLLDLALRGPVPPGAVAFSPCAAVALLRCWVSDAPELVSLRMVGLRLQARCCVPGCCPLHRSRTVLREHFSHPPVLTTRTTPPHPKEGARVFSISLDSSAPLVPQTSIKHHSPYFSRRRAPACSPSPWATA